MQRLVSSLNTKTDLSQMEERKIISYVTVVLHMCYTAGLRVRGRGEGGVPR